MKRIRLLRKLASACFLLALPASAQNWQPPPAKVRAAAGKLAPALRQAMNSGQQKQVDAVVEQLRKTLGEWAGHTEVETRYQKPINPGDPPSLAQIREGWASLFSSTEALYQGNGRWRSSAPAPLRETCDVLLGYSKALEAKAADQARLRQRIREGLNYLLTVQAANGVFPFPDLRGKDPFFGPMLERYVAQHPDAIQNGWMVRDEGDGGLQFDNGVCGNAMLAGYRQLGDTKYLDSARRAADWAAAHALVSVHIHRDGQQGDRQSERATNSASLSLQSD